MNVPLSAAQCNHRAAFRQFVDTHVRPFADQWHEEEAVPSSVINLLAESGYLGATLPKGSGGGGMDLTTFALWMEELGAGCTSLRSLVTVHCMAADVLQRWGRDVLRDTWIPKLASGEALAAFALSEPQAGSDAASIATTGTTDGDEIVLNGTKKWTTFGQIADAFLVFAQIDGEPGALWVEHDRPGLSVEPMTGLIGARASLTAFLHFDGCRVPAECVVGQTGFGFHALLTTGLTHGRLSVAMGCVGLARACLAAATRYTREREQFGSPIKEFQLVRGAITDMAVDVEAARLMGYRAASLLDASHPDGATAAAQAKYVAARAAVDAANTALQLHGGNGCLDRYPLHRYLADAKVMEVIEGTTQVLQDTLAEAAYRSFPAGSNPSTPTDSDPSDLASLHAASENSLR